MARTVEEYLELPYTIEITPDDGTFFVKVKELDGCMAAFGPTPINSIQRRESQGSCPLQDHVNTEQEDQYAQ